jgi:arginine exporter protein ArgO
MFVYLIQGLVLGLAAGAQPGPFQTYLISQTLSQGWRRTWIAAFAPLVSDGPIVALVLFVLSQVPDWFQRLLQITGGFFVLYLAWGAFKAWKRFSPDASVKPPAARCFNEQPQPGSLSLLEPGDRPIDRQHLAGKPGRCPVYCGGFLRCDGRCEFRSSSAVRAGCPLWESGA